MKNKLENFLVAATVIGGLAVGEKMHLGSQKNKDKSSLEMLQDSNKQADKDLGEINQKDSATAEILK